MMPKRLKNISKRVKIALVAAAVLCALGAVAGGIGLHLIHGNAVEKEGSVYIPTGCDYAALRDSLADKIDHQPIFDLYSRYIGLDQSVKPGHYHLAKGMSIVELARSFLLGRQTPVDVVIRSVRLPGQLAREVGQQLEADSASIHLAMLAPDLLADYGFKNEFELFSIFIPNTYEMWWTESPVEFIRRMKREYDRFWDDSRLDKLDAVGLNRMEAITLASILNEETQKTDEMPTMAGVYINRLRKGMKLQADPTVKYAMGDFGLRRILRRYLTFDSPYNTYLHTGLPPTPIRMPTIAAIDAVLNYRPSNYLFFVARADFSGYHTFTTTYAEHLASARLYSAALDARGIH